MSALDEILQFLPCATPDSWLQAALQQQDVMLIDHANCEKKAASTALNLLYRYVDKPELLHKMSRLAREELRHFEQVCSLLQQRGIDYIQLSSSRYAGGMREEIRSSEPERLVDTLIVGAFIEARSCERFARIAPLLDEELSAFYRSLLKSEARHYQDYLGLAQRYAKDDISERVEQFAAREQQLVQSEDSQFRFHSGAPVA